MKASMTILFIDDDTDDADLFEEAIGELFPKATCRFARNGEEGLQCLHDSVRELPDVIFLDLNMPRMDGKSFLRQVKQVEAFSEIPVVIYSTSSSRLDKMETHTLGAAYFLTKPVSQNVLLKELTKVFSQIFRDHSE